MFCQRWNERRSYRAPASAIDTTAHEVVSIGDDTTAKAFVLHHHYSGSYPAARFRFGLYRGVTLSGVAVFSHPVNEQVLTGTFRGVPVLESAELGRFVLLDEVPANGETWFLGRCFELLRREGLRGVVSYSDPVPRETVDGRLVMPGHVGLIYQAHNGVYLGRGRRRTIRLLPDGTVFNDRTAQKVRRREQGWESAAGVLQRFGADHVWQDSAAWLRHWLAQTTRKVSHPGNHKYAWALSRGLRKSVVAMSSLPYPKRIAC